jgi:WD40 repeat protein
MKLLNYFLHLNYAVLVGYCGMAAGQTRDSISSYQSYLAHISAANASLRLNEPNEARRWLESAPGEYRGWEYDFISASLDKSVGVIDSLPAQPLAQDFSSNGRLLAVACEDSLVRIYDFESKSKIKELSGFRGAVFSANFFPTDDKILTCSRDSIIRVWNLNGEIIAERKAGGQGLASADISPSGDKIAYASWKRTDTGIVGIVSLWDAATLEKVWETDFDVKPIVIVKFSPDGSKFAIGTWNWKVAIWNANQPGKPAIFDFDDVPTYAAIDDIAFSPDGKRIAAATKCGTPRVWDIASGTKLLELHGHEKPVMSISFGSDGRSVYTGGNDATISIWDINTGIKLSSLFGHSNSVNSMEFRPLKGISTAAQLPGAAQFTTISSDRTIRIWDAATDLEFQNSAGRAPNSYGFSLSGDGKFLAVGGKNGSMSIWNAINGELINNFDALATIVNAADFSPDGKLLLVCSWDSVVKVFDVPGGREVYVKKEMRRGGPSCAFSPDGQYFAVGSNDNRAYIWNAKNGKMAFILNHPGAVSYVAFSPDGKYLLTAAANGLVTVWSTGKWENIAAVEENGVVHCIDFSPDSTSFVAVGRSGKIRIRDTFDGKPKMELDSRESLIWSVAYSPDGQRLATGSAENTIRIWDTKSGACTLIISDLSDPVYNLTFSPDGTRLYANSSGTELKIFDTVPVRERLKALKQTSTK